MYECPKCQEDVTPQDLRVLVCPNCRGVYHHTHPDVSGCVRQNCAGAQLRSIFDWDQIGVFIMDNTPENNPVEYPCGACDESIRRQSFLPGGGGGAFVCQRCRTAYHGKHSRQCDLHPGAQPNVTHYDGWAMFTSLGGALTDRHEIDELKAAAVERKNKVDERERQRKLAGRPVDLDKLGELGEQIRRADALVAKITSSEKVGGEPKVSGSTIWLVGHSTILPETTPVPEGVSITFYSEPGSTSEMAGNTFVLETLGGSRPGHFVTGKVLNQMSFGPTKDDEAALGRAKIIEETPNAYTIGQGPFADCSKLCGATDPSACDHSTCDGALGIVKRRWPGADLRIIGCRGTQARGRADLNPGQQRDKLAGLAANAAQYEMRKDPEPLSKHLQTRLDEAGLGNREEASLRYKPGNPQFEGDLTYLGQQQIRQAREDPATFEASYRDMPARARADMAISDKSGVLQNPRFKIADLQAETSRTASEITNYLISLSTRLLEARGLETVKSSAVVALADQAIDAQVGALLTLIQELQQFIQDAVGGPEGAELRRRYPELAEEGKLRPVLDRTAAVMNAANGLIRAVEADDSIENKAAATRKCQSIKDAAAGHLYALTESCAKLRQQGARLIQLQQAAATDADTRRWHRT